MKEQVEEEAAAGSSIYKVCRNLKRTEHSLYNSLRSIFHDSLFVRDIASLWPHLPLLANLRCGLWYSPSFHASCYFKSTDGHSRNCSFSTSRLNLHVASLAAHLGGCFIVDATRRGKRFPDSFSRTIPIWTCVLNRAIHEFRQRRDGFCDFSPALESLGKCMGDGEVEQPAEPLLSNSSDDPESTEAAPQHSWDCSLHLPLWVSDTEKESIERRLDEWVEILRATGADLASLAESLKKPLRPLWISQKTVVWLNEVPDAACWTFTPVILVSASEPISSVQRMSDGDFSWSYIPGAADDEESWARGLTPLLFWKHAQSLIEDSSPDQCNRMVADIVERDRVCRAYRGLEAEQVRVKPSRKPSQDGRHKPEDVQGTSDSCHDQDYCRRNDDGMFPPKQFLDFHWIGETRLAVGNASCGQSGNLFNVFDCAINCGVEAKLLSGMGTSSYLHLLVVSSKQDRFSLQNHLSRVVAFAKEKLTQGCKLLIFCSDGEDLSICVCLAILIALFDGRGAFDDGCNFAKVGVSKWDVRQHLVYLCNFVPNARPSRGGLRQVYNFLSSFSLGSDTAL